MGIPTRILGEQRGPIEILGTLQFPPSEAIGGMELATPPIVFQDPSAIVTESHRFFPTPGIDGPIEKSLPDIFTNESLLDKQRGFFFRGRFGTPIFFRGARRDKETKFTWIGVGATASRDSRGEAITEMELGFLEPFPIFAIVHLETIPPHPGTFQEFIDEKATPLGERKIEEKVFDPTERGFPSWKELSPTPTSTRSSSKPFMMLSRRGPSSQFSIEP